jgi:hypothetical protein
MSVPRGDVAKAHTNKLAGLKTWPPHSLFTWWRDGIVRTYGAHSRTVRNIIEPIQIRDFANVKRIDEGWTWLD